MKIIITITIFLCSSYTLARELVGLVNKKLSQGYVAPILTERGIIIPDRHGTLYSFDIDNPRIINWKLYLSDKKKIGNMSLSSYKESVFFIVDNILYTVDIKTGEILWKKELRAPARGEAKVINNKLVILTIDNYLHTLDIKDGRSVWAYQNGVNEVRGLYSISPAIYNGKIIAPFSNGELIAFDEEGKKLWSQKLDSNFLETQLTDISTTPRVQDNILIATSNSYVYSIDVNSGNVLWSRSLQVKSISEIESYSSSIIPVEKQKKSGRIFIVTKDDGIIGMDIQSGKIIWKYDLTENLQLFAPIVYANTLWVTSNRASIFAFPEFKSTKKIIKIPGNVFHTPVFTDDKIYITTERNGVLLLENRFIFYD